LTFIR